MERTITPEGLKALLSGDNAPTLLDVRRGDDRAKDPTAIPGALWHDPAALDAWAGDLDPAGEIVLYCVRGGSVSNSVVDALQVRGLKARFIEGGLEAWRAAGGETSGG